MSLRITTGSTAEGEEKYFPRPLITNRIWRKIENGENLLVTAPRRVGKSSILKNMARENREGYIVKYLIVQSVDGENEFYKLLFNEFIEDESIFNWAERYRKKASAAAKEYIRKIQSIGIEQVSLDQSQALNYSDELKALICSIDEKCPKIVVVVDEFPHAVENILRDDSEKAVHFLQKAREIRQNNKINEKVTFVYTGSIGLGNIVKGINQSNLINDISPIPVSPLTSDEAHHLVIRLVEGLKKYNNIDLDVSEEEIAYLIERIEWLIPYFFQILIEELSDMFEEGKTINCPAID